MIKLIRIDDRLVHGQVATYYVNMTGADTILVANDKYATNAMLKNTLKIAKPVNCKMPVRTIDDAILYLNNPEKANRTILLIVGSTADALKICKSIDKGQEVNIGGIIKADNTKAISNQVFLGEKDIENIKEIESLGNRVYLQEVPSKADMSVKDIISAFNK